jgi:alpha-beta hydrolase superfamily lysophospholipase
MSKALQAALAQKPEEMLADDNSQQVSAIGSPLGVPVTFGTFSGFYYAGTPDQAAQRVVLMLGPIGYEEMCARTTWRSLAETIAATGHACLRFDYPGTADALDLQSPPDGVVDWIEAARTCAAFLQNSHPGAELLLVGQGFGASLAAQLGSEIPGVTAVVLMAPVIKGRSYLRELQAWARVCTERIGIEPDPLDENGYGVAGFSLVDARAAAVRGVDLTQLATTPAPRVLVVERPHSGADRAFGEQLSRLGAEVSRIAYDGYDIILTDPTQAEPPLATLDRISAWISNLPRVPKILNRQARPALGVPVASLMMGEGFEELPLRFGRNGQLFGVLCRPKTKSSAIVLLVNAGRDYHIGWGRATVEQARALATRGIASLRFDAGGIGDSARDPGDVGEVIYSDGQITEIRQAIDHVEPLGLGPITLIGRCSGAYAAFNTAVRDARVRRVIIVNVERFVWDPTESIAEALRYAHRSIGDFGSTLLRTDGLKRLLTGKLRVRAAAGYIASRLAKQLGVKFGRFLPGITTQGRLYGEVHRRFRELASRGVRIALVFSTGDLGLQEFRTFMGQDGERLRRYDGTSVTLVPDADHNFTHSAARARLTRVLCDMLDSDGKA